MNSTNNPLLFASIVNENAIRAKENAKPKTAGYIKNIFCIIGSVCATVLIFTALLLFVLLM